MTDQAKQPKCPECGQDTGAAHKVFCCPAHRKAFNNRRAMRGAELYDAFMAMRFDRNWSKAVGLWQLISRLCSEWRRDDQLTGRASFIRPQAWVDANKASLRAQTIDKGSRK